MKKIPLKVFNFRKQSSQFKFLFPIMFVLGVVALSSFILTSFWKYDWLSAEFFARGMKYTAVKYWTQLYLIIGYTELFVTLFILIMVLVESVFKKSIQKKSNGFFSKNRWIVVFIYLLFFSIWIPLNVYEIIAYNWKDKGFGPGVDPEILDSYKFKQTGKIIVFVLQTIILFFGSYYVHFRLIKKKNFWKEEYWIGAIKGIVFFIIIYIVIAFLKSLLSRPYYYNCIFGDLLEGLKKNGHEDWVQNYLTQTQFKYGFNNGDGLWANNIPGEWPWYKANGFFESEVNMPQYLSQTDYAFPSGHVGGTYCVSTLFFLVLKKDKKLNWPVKLLLILFLIHVLSMSFAVVVMLGHWISDVAFSHVWALMLFPFVNWIVNHFFHKRHK